uniref:Uncharacterized protein n=1 Tax=Panagrolaimus sp. PS1159 TaxID=55785 RepID=A0AC35G3C8_9BILA
MYFTPSPEHALNNYGVELECDKKKYKLIIQVRIDYANLGPENIKSVEETGRGVEYWIATDKEQIRPYGICIYPLDN